MDKQVYIERKILIILQSWGAMATLGGAIVFLGLIILDYFVVPEHFLTFLYYRLIAASLFLGLFFLNRLKVSRYFQVGIFFLGTSLSSVTVELMVIATGGHQAIYYAGMIIIMVFSLGFLPLFSIRTTILLATITYLIYLVPILVFDSISNMRVFINNNIFLLATAFLGVIWRYSNDKLLKQNLSLQYELEQQNRHLENIVTERTKELQKSEQQLRALFENATDGIVVMNTDGIIVNANNRTCEMHGYTREELIGTSIWQLEAESNPTVRHEIMRRILAREPVVFETTQLRKNGTFIPLEISSKAIDVDGTLLVQSFYRDLTEKKKLQAHLMQSQKMESIGMLAGGIAHDFNNILTAILGHTEIVRLFPHLDAKSLRSLQVIEDASRKAGATITKLLGFARRSNYEMLPLNVNDVINDTHKMLERVLDKNITLETNLAEHLPVIKGDFNQLEQIIMNLIVNAKDAMPKGGRILLTTSHEKISKNMPNMPAYVQPGDYVQISVTDTGCGIPENLVQKIFEPFFTTKEQGKGTGLGLSMCYGAVMEHKGHIMIQSKIGYGSTFIILLPTAQSDLSLSAEQTPAPSKGSETILVVDDEDFVLSAIQETLAAHGYRVLIANDPVLGLDVFKKMSHDIALVITDMVMPKIDGKEFMKRLREIHPQIRLLAISGYMKDVAEKSEIKNMAWFLQKPFEYRDLLVQIRQILDSRSHNPSHIQV
jgi:PAS domain S-box-containing protein